MICHSRVRAPRSNLRHGLNSDLGFSNEDRAENVRRVAHLSRILADAGIIVLACFISPTRAMRGRVRELVGDAHNFAECFVDAPLAVSTGPLAVSRPKRPLQEGKSWRDQALYGHRLAL